MQTRLLLIKYEPIYMLNKQKLFTQWMIYTHCEDILLKSFMEKILYCWIEITARAVPQNFCIIQSNTIIPL